ncbi:hypothetical protein [Hymenobacter sp. YC55]|uniref:hypothetical protein n=1 Tax=Hymenobacter sp. YC55 TaxID=3034019 RepID=UPI0023F80648|nr:hypothetical protein [Hymenobacter sp. YC55]MDF7815136.1 hypothetical protein [Hymenobacter sp. YC55]
MTLTSCLEKQEPDAVPAYGAKPILKNARKISFIIDGAYDLSQTEVHSTLDSTAMDGEDKGLLVPAAYPSAVFFLDNTSGQILAVVQTDTVRDQVPVNATSVAQALLPLVPAYHSLTPVQQITFERNAPSLKPFQDFVVQVDALLKSKRPIYSTEPAYVNKLVELNSYILKNLLGTPDLTAGRTARVVNQFKDWVAVEGGGTLINQVHSYVYAEFIPSNGGNTVKTLLDPQPVPAGRWSKKPLAELGLKDDYYTVHLNQTHESVVAKNYYELSSRMAKMFLNVFLGRLGEESRSDCIAAIAGAIQVDITATMLELGGGASIPAQEVLLKISQVAGNTLQTAFTNSACQKTLLNKSVIAKALAAQTNVFMKTIQAVSMVYELAEFFPFVFAQANPVIMSDKMQVYKGKLVPGWVSFQEIKGSVTSGYAPSVTVRPAVEAKILSFYDKIDLGQFEAAWTVESGHGQVTPKTPFNADGKTVTSWRLPTPEGTYALKAEVLDREKEHLMGSPVKFEVKVKDSIAIYKAAAVGSWTVTGYDPNNPPSTYRFRLFADGTGVYPMDGTGFTRDVPIRWSIESTPEGYILKEQGWWHPAYTDDRITKHARLKYPLTGYKVYSSPQGYPNFTFLSQVYTKN